MNPRARIHEINRILETDSMTPGYVDRNKRRSLARERARLIKRIEGRDAYHACTSRTDGGLGSEELKRFGVKKKALEIIQTIGGK